LSARLEMCPFKHVKRRVPSSALWSAACVIQSLPTLVVPTAGASDLFRSDTIQTPHSLGDRVGNLGGTSDVVPGDPPLGLEQPQPFQLASWSRSPQGAASDPRTAGARIAEPSRRSKVHRLDRIPPATVCACHGTTRSPSAPRDGVQGFISTITVAASALQHLGRAGAENSSDRSFWRVTRSRRKSAFRRFSFCSACGFLESYARPDVRCQVTPILMAPLHSCLPRAYLFPGPLRERCHRGMSAMVTPTRSS